MRLTWTGTREMARALRTMGAAAGQVLAAGVGAGAGIIHRRAVELARVRRGPRRRPRTKQLADTIKVGLDERTRASVRVAIYTKSSIAHLREYGHEQIPRGPGRKKLGSQQRMKRAVGVRWKVVRRTLVSGAVVTRTLLVTRKRSFVTGMHGELRRKLEERRAAGSRGRVPAYPFLRPAFDETREAALRRMAEVIGKGIEQHWRRTARAPAQAAA